MYFNYRDTIMGAGNSVYTDKQEAYVSRHYEDVKKQLSGTRSAYGDSYSSTQIKSKLRQEYNSNGFSSSSRYDKDDYINYDTWKSTGKRN